jgi:tRNA pseudouridine38-40 synthase
VQGEIIDAMEKWDGQRHSVDTVQLSGRTDRGVHSFGQIGVLSTDKIMNLDEINRNLPDDISLWAYTEAPTDFKPRYSILARHYRYYHRIIDEELDIDLIRYSIGQLVGSHDYALISKPDGDRNTISTILNASIKLNDEMLIFDFIGTRFLWKLVRKSVAILLEIGLGRKSPQTISNLLSMESIAGGIEPASPEGLVLIESIIPIIFKQSKNAVYRIRKYLEDHMRYFMRLYSTFSGVSADFLSERKIPF